MKETASRVRHYRRAKNWTQTELGRAAALPTPTVCMIELGRVPLHAGWRRRLALALDVPEHDLS